jgi:hypothetical protein
VRPGKSATSASRVFVRRLNKVDFPTLGRPTRATTGNIYQILKVMKAKKHKPQAFNNEVINALDNSINGSLTTCGF